ncbi:MAG TPA: hypothetical protein VHE11_15305 [Steroidobacteraceae bacterium]|nr:hypothetical protein [Steroidobacteraceae bacterium]
MSKLPLAAGRAALLAVPLALTMLSGCAQQTPLLNQPLAWTPTNTLDLGVTQSRGAPATVRFQTFGDTAPDPKLVGENVEQTTPRPVTTADPVGPFVTQHLQQLFTQAGYPAAGANADRVISGEVSKFFVKEGNNYSGSVVLDVTVSDRSGKVLWQGTVWGANQTFGRSYHLDNYQQVLSDSLIDAANNLLKNPAVRTSLTLN